MEYFDALKEFNMARKISEIEDELCFARKIIGALVKMRGIGKDITINKDDWMTGKDTLIIDRIEENKVKLIIELKEN